MCSIILEWILFLGKIVTGYFGSSPYPEDIKNTPVLNKLLVGLMFLGILCLICANYQNFLPMGTKEQILPSSSSKKKSKVDASIKNRLISQLRNSISVRIFLISGFFLSCVFIPFFGYLPFVETNHSNERIQYFFDYKLKIYEQGSYDFSYFYSQSLGSFNSPWFVVGIFGWSMIGLGSFISCFAVWTIIRENILGIPTSKNLFLLFSILVILAIIAEWIILLLLIDQGVPSFLLLGIMAFGILCLLIVEINEKISLNSVQISA